MAKYTYVAGLSGKEIVRMTMAQAEQCSHPGQCDADVEATINNVEWLADADTIRSDLKESGAWDAIELADDEQNKRRVLWCAACSITEDPGMYADDESGWSTVEA